MYIALHVFTYNYFCELVFMLRTGSPAFLVYQYPWAFVHPLIFITQYRLAIPHHTFTVRCRTIRFICSAYYVLSFIFFGLTYVYVVAYCGLRSAVFWLDSTSLNRTRVGLTLAALYRLADYGCIKILRQKSTLLLITYHASLL